MSDSQVGKYLNDYVRQKIPQFLEEKLNADKWDRRFMDLALLVSTWSKDPSTKVGAAIVDADHRVISVGYNGLPKGIEDSDERLQDRETKLALTLHAEVNAASFANQSIKNCTVYSTRPPCSLCAAILAQRGIYRVVTLRPSEEFLSRWAYSLALSEEVFEEADIILDYIDG